MQKEKIFLKDYWDELDAPKRKKLIALFEKNKLPYFQAIRRMKIIGFSNWEYYGIETILKEYGLKIPKERTKFWGRLEKKEDFYTMMRTKGMSRVTAHSKFSRFTFTPWQKVGIKNLIEKFEKSLLS